jgi:hypothetical protein
MGVWHWFLSVTGTSNESGLWYGWWSGFGADLTEFAIFAIVWRKVNCHAKGCFRVGLHRVDGTPYITCRKHHPVHPGKASATAEDIAAAHRRSHDRSTALNPAKDAEDAAAIEQAAVDEAAGDRRE